VHVAHVPNSSRAAFTLVEIIVALTLMAVGAAALASALTVDRQLRDAARVRARMAAQFRVRLGAIAATHCPNETSGVAHDWWGDERWRAIGAGARARLIDSLIPARPVLAVRSTAVDTEVACLP
jgi:prepilin-type N-terminal cleavage/methylation domain-containing protein